MLAVVVRDTARVAASHCALRQCSEAAVLVGHSARAHLEACHLAECTAAFMSGQGRGGRALEVHGCTVDATVRKVRGHACTRAASPPLLASLLFLTVSPTIVQVWADADRPATYVWSEGNTRVEPPEMSDADHMFASGHMGIVREQPPLHTQSSPHLILLP